MNLSVIGIIQPWSDKCVTGARVWRQQVTQAYWHPNLQSCIFFKERRTCTGRECMIAGYWHPRIRSFCEWSMIGFNLTFEWMTKWSKLFKSITYNSNAKLKKLWINFSTQVKTALTRWNLPENQVSVLLWHTFLLLVLTDLHCKTQTKLNAIVFHQSKLA